jgi:hypothetical protein
MVRSSFVDPIFKIGELAVEISLVVLPCHPVHPRRGVPLEGIERFPEPVEVDMVQKCGELDLLTSPCGLPYAVQPLCHAFPSQGSERASLVRIPLGPRPWLHRLRHRSPSLVRRLLSYYVGVRLLTPVHHGLRLLAFPMRADTVARCRSNVRSPRFRCCRFVRDGFQDRGRASVPRLTAPHMLPSTSATVSASAILRVSRLNILPRTITVYASSPASPLTMQHSLPGGPLPLTWAGLSPAGLHQLSWLTAEFA